MASDIAKTFGQIIDIFEKTRENTFKKVNEAFL